jgi:Na+(H+)/acetate symporter ActP
MHIDPWILTFSVATVVATIWMGFWSARKSKTAHDFFVAGRSVSVGWNASAISGEYLSAASFMGVAGMVMKNGYDALWYPVCYACGYLFLLLFIAGPLRRFGAYTIPDFAEGRYDSPLFRKIAVIFVLFIGFFYTMPQMKGAGTTLAYIFPGLPYWAGVVLVGAVITLNVALGGMKGITLVQAVQYWAKMFAISVPVFVLMAVYGHYGTQVRLNNPPAGNIDFGKKFEFKLLEKNWEPRLKLGMSFLELVRYVRVKSNKLRAKPPPTDAVFAPGAVRFVNSDREALLSIYEDLTGRTVLQVNVQYPGNNYNINITNSISRSDLIQLMESKLAEARIALLPYGENIVISCPFSRTNEIAHYVANFGLAEMIRKPVPEKAPKDATWLSPFGPLTTKAAKAANLSPQQAKPYSLLYTYSLIIALVCGTAGLPHILVRFYTNPDGAAAKRTTMWVMILIGIFYLFPPIFGVLGRNLLPELYAAAGAKGTDKIVLELPRILNERFPVWGSVLSGITCAGAFAAFMSTFSGLLVSMTGALAHDVYGRILRPRSTPEQRLKAFKVSAVMVGAVAIMLGMQVELFDINFMVGQAFAIAAASYFPLLFLSAWWRNMTMKGAATGMLAGGILALGGITLTSFSDLKWLPLEAFWASHPLLRILCEQPAIWTVPLAITLMILISKCTRGEVPSDVRMKMLVLHAPENLGLKQEYIQEHAHGLAATK